MKKLFSKRSGFTLVEIVIAFAIFVIMAAMIMQMLNLAINQRRSNVDFERTLAEQEEFLAQGGKDTGYDSAKAGEDDKINLNFKDKDGNNAVDFDMNYQMKPADPDNPNAADGINYFVGDFNYGTDGTGSSGGGGSAGGSGGASQASRYDTRITGSKGLQNITIKPQKIDESPIPLTDIPEGYTWYKITVSADSSKMLNEDKQISQFRIYFYDANNFDSVKQEDESGNVTYKKVYKQAQLDRLFYISTEAKSDTYLIEPNSNSIRFSIQKGMGTNGFDPSHNITFYCLFEGDPELDNDSFGANGTDGVYNASPVYNDTLDGVLGATPDKTHVNIYGSFPFETSKNPFPKGGA